MSRQSRRTSKFACALLAMAIGTLPGRLHSAQLTPGKTLVTDFKVLANVSGSGFQNDQINSIMTEFFEYTTPQPISSITAKLFDGNGLLATHVVSFPPPDFPYNYFRSPTSSLTYKDPATFDFGGIHDRTINGRMEVTVESGVLEFDPFFYRVGLGRAVGSSGIDFYPWVSQTTRIIPEPATCCLLVAGTTFIPSVRRSRRSRTA